MKVLKRLWKKIRLPLPKECGWAKSNALEILWIAGRNGNTWEEFDEFLKANYPVRYFIFNNVGDFFRSCWLKVAVPVNTLWYWLVSHIVPSKRYHMLDLRQPIMEGELSNIDVYRWGYKDVSERMLYAMFNLLREYLKGVPEEWLNDEFEIEPEDEVWVKQMSDLKEAKDLWHWWSVGRKEKKKEYSKLLNKWSKLKGTSDGDVLFEELNVLEKDMETEEEEMVMRLVKIRKTLWN